ncbi:F-box protein [Frankliniella fusca]|uniref:F-box protein n=1 Tax=Frankliniella fusca TaxID=407009 RepID=A0AAE1GRD7_9NEOP|nr:F-box protein [Frankliniella fusca]
MCSELQESRRVKSDGSDRGGWGRLCATRVQGTPRTLCAIYATSSRSPGAGTVVDGRVLSPGAMTLGEARVLELGLLLTEAAMQDSVRDGARRAPQIALMPPSLSHPWRCPMLGMAAPHECDEDRETKPLCGLTLLLAALPAAAALLPARLGLAWPGLRRKADVGGEQRSGVRPGRGRRCRIRIEWRQRRRRRRCPAPRLTASSESESSPARVEWSGRIPITIIIMIELLLPRPRREAGCRGVKRTRNERAGGLDIFYGSYGEYQWTSETDLEIGFTKSAKEHHCHANPPSKLSITVYERKTNNCKNTEHT